ncbi:hypothetical protein RchiOBHm_Chr2g0157421 [Rosa chinensis]|uniref:Transmembrane protein n=1 Tax=Rosa chinensis TaxID=74649 RepID=A0A2P6S1S7_ROSCH|nr:hypothetical protein RchiOBHm_Chr2g0157421 [Rosa chinensis]
MAASNYSHYHHPPSLFLFFILMSITILLTHLIICVNAGDGEATNTAAEAPSTSLVQGRSCQNSWKDHAIKIYLLFIVGFYLVGQALLIINCVITACK